MQRLRAALWSHNTAATRSDSEAYAEEQLFIFLRGLIARQDLIVQAIAEYERAKRKISPERQAGAIDAYFSLERFITSHEPPIVKQRFNKPQLRAAVAEQSFTPQLAPRLRLIFLPSPEQEMLISQIALNDVAEAMHRALGPSHLVIIVDNVLEQRPLGGITVQKDALHINFSELQQSIENAKKTAPYKKEDVTYFDFLRPLYTALASELEESLGRPYAQEVISASFQFFKKHYADYNIISNFLNLVPEPWLQDERLAFLSREELARLVQEKTEELLKAEAEKRTEAEKHNQELEDKVRERTQALQDALERLQELDELKSEFLNLAAHELRTPLTSIHWLCSELLDGSLGQLNAKQQELIAAGLERSRYMITLVGDLLNASKIEEKNTLQLTTIDVTKEIPLILKGFEEAVQVKNIELTCRIPKTVEPISLDLEQMTIVLSNLIDNAIKYTSLKGKISVTAKQTANKLVLTVKDTGIGIPQNQLRYIFSKFFRAKNAIALHANGSGLGLYIAHNIVKRHGGSLSVESREGKGTTFTIMLPYTKGAGYEKGVQQESANAD